MTAASAPILQLLQQLAWATSTLQAMRDRSGTVRDPHQPSFAGAFCTLRGGSCALHGGICSAVVLLGEMLMP